jgi:hypothetical protein
MPPAITPEFDLAKSAGEPLGITLLEGEVVIDLVADTPNFADGRAGEEAESDTRDDG